MRDALRAAQAVCRASSSAARVHLVEISGRLREAYSSADSRARLLRMRSRPSPGTMHTRRGAGRAGDRHRQRVSRRAADPAARVRATAPGASASSTSSRAAPAVRAGRQGRLRVGSASERRPGAIVELRAGEDELLAALAARAGALRRALHRLRPRASRHRRHAAGRAPARLRRSAGRARQRRPDGARAVRAARRQGARCRPRRRRADRRRPSFSGASASPSARHG